MITEFDISSLNKTSDPWYRRLNVKTLAIGFLRLLAGIALLVALYFVLRYIFSTHVAGLIFDAVIAALAVFVGKNVATWIVIIITIASLAFVIRAFIRTQTHLYSEQEGYYAVEQYSNRVEVRDILSNLTDGSRPSTDLDIDAILSKTDQILASHSSEHVTPPEHRPERRIVAALIRMALITASLMVAFAILLLVVASTGAPFRAIVGFLQLSFGIGGVFALIFSLQRRARKKSAEHLIEYDERPPIVFLRSFKDDKNKILLALKESAPATVMFEEALSNVFFRLGPFVALGSKREFLPRLGAARTYPDDSVWQAKASRWMRDARLIIYMLGTSEGLRWEVDQIIERNLFHKTVFVFPHGTSLLTRSNAKKKARVWSHFQRSFKEATISELLSTVDPSEVMLFWIGQGDRAYVVKGQGAYFHDYELALRIAIYFHSLELGQGPAQQSAS
jgi:hypothetical protein